VQKQKVVSAIFNQYGFAISKALLTKDVKCRIHKANDCGPRNSVKGGSQFFKGFFKEVSKSPPDCQCDELTQMHKSKTAKWCIMIQLTEGLLRTIK